MENNQTYSKEATAWLQKELADIRQHIVNLKKGVSLTSEWLPRHQVMEFFGYGDTQMGTLEKSGDLVVSKIGNRKFYHRASIFQLLQANIQGV